MYGETLSVREKKILSTLLQTNNYVTASELAKILNVSEKTIYRDLKSIKQKLGRQNIIQQNRGKGYYIQQKSAINASDLNEAQSDFYGMDVNSRRRNIMILLLLQTPIETSINKLAELYYISNTSIVNDLNIIENELSEYDLSLYRSRNGTHIVGSEFNIRRLLMQKINEFAFNTEQSLLTITNDDNDIHNLYSFFSPKDINFVKLLLDNTEKILCGKIKDPYYINIFTHILILIKRLGNNENLSKNNDAANFNYKDKLIKDCASMIVQKLEKYLNLNIPLNETYHIYQYLYSSRIDNEDVFSNIDISNVTDEESSFVNYLLSNVSRALKVNLMNDPTLKNSLLLHLLPLNKRIENNIFISNPLKNDIKKNFSEIFNVVKSIIRKQTLMPGFIGLSDDEIAYIAVYFQVALEKKFQQKRIGIICSTGIGTSHLLAARVKRAFPEWKIVDIVSSNHADKFTPANVDLILTTVKIKKEDVPWILVSAIFNQMDIIKVKQFLATI